MPAFTVRPLRLALAAGLAASLALAACGGGGGGDAAAPVAQAPVAPAPVAPPPAAPPAPPSGGGDPVQTTSNAATVGTARALGASASVAVGGVSDAPTPAQGASTGRGGRLFYVDSRTGNDSNDGRAETTGAGQSGPWKSLARVLTSDLGAGDALQMACGSEWNETLRVPASGTANLPVSVGAPPAGCGVRPMIDGSVALPAANWTLHQGKVFKTTLAAPPLQLSMGSTGTVWTEAHHPNRGHLVSDPGSPYLRAAGSDTVPVGVQHAATSVLVGPDLVLPPGAELAAGARVAARMYSWTIQERAVASATRERINFTSPMDYPIGAGWGYFLLGQLWMVDSAGEWFHDATARQLYAYMADGAAPSTAVRATVLATGIDLQGRSHVIVDGLAVRRVGLGADLRDSRGLLLRNTRFDDIAGIGADVSKSTNAVIESCAFTRTGTDAISGWRHDTGPSAGLTVRNSVIRDAGVVMQDDSVQSLPRRSYAAIYGGTGSTISGNTVVNAGYIGIQVMPDSLVEKNFVYGACSVLDDCAGIYTQYGNNRSVIRGNTVVHARGALAGKAPDMAYTQAQGIYLDSGVTGALIEDNTVVDTDNGIQVHVSAQNIVRGNRLYGNRRSQIWMQDTSNLLSAGGDVLANQVTDNQIAPVAASSVGIWLDTIYASTAAFGTIDRNRYFDRAAPIAVRVSTAAGARDYTFAQWQQAAGDNLPAARDNQGAAVSATGHAAHSVSGSNVVPNSGLLNDAAGWQIWSPGTPAAQLVREACPAGICLRYVAGAAPGLVSSQNFSVTKDQWYRMSLDLASEEEGQVVDIVVRRGGGGSNGYDSVADRNFVVTAGRGWKRYSRVFRATTTVNFRDPLTGDLGARADIAPAGQVLRIANVELVPVTPDATAQLSTAFTNVGNATRSWDCPHSGAQAALCGKLRRFADNGIAGWPLAVPAASTLIVYASEPALLDSDHDGVADVHDTCTATPAGVEVNAAGCPLILR